MWELGLGKRQARCVLQGHPMGVEARVEIDGDVVMMKGFRESKT